MYVCVTGVAGFIGFHLAKKLINEGFAVIGIDNLNSYYDTNLKLDRLYELKSQLSNVELEMNRTKLETQKSIGQMQNNLRKAELKLQYQNVNDFAHILPI